MTVRDAYTFSEQRWAYQENKGTCATFIVILEVTQIQQIQDWKLWINPLLIQLSKLLQKKKKKTSAFWVHIILCDSFSSYALSDLLV